MTKKKCCKAVAYRKEVEPFTIADLADEFNLLWVSFTILIHLILSTLIAFANIELIASIDNYIGVFFFWVFVLLFSLGAGGIFSVVLLRAFSRSERTRYVPIKEK